MARLPLVEFSRDTAEHWTDLFAMLGRTGKMIPANDLAIAATALQLGFRVIVGLRGELTCAAFPRKRGARLG